ncbi:MAG: hypothetical protein KatS3mg124_0637 [Porticoccaceae bacterium]|nr:MAG: hypothetical protein KatS3mg124_0637 [Porticoccaceae bacterium]
MADVGVPITARIICEQLGLDFAEIGVARIQRWTRALLAQMGRMQTRAEFLDNARALCEMHHFLVPAIRERQRKPREDMISDLVHARLPGDDRPALSFPEQVSCVRAILVAGNDTTAAAIANLLWILATEPDALHWLADHTGDSQALTLFLEELLRLLPPVHGLYRTALREVEVGGVRIPAGAQVCVLFASANRDEALFAEPDHFLRQRPEAIRHLTFGAGIHRCLGAALARMELRVVAEEIVRRFATIHLTVPVESLDYLPTLATQTLTRLPLSFEARDSC